ncbi:hypothetical protein GCM10027589_37420 [Actinocorallia lasiicapitis]
MSTPHDVRVAVGGMGFGDHLCLPYDNDHERRAVLVAYLRDGLKHDHKIIYLADTDGPAEILAWLTRDPEAAGLDLAGAMDRDQFVVRTAEEAYLATGRFDPDEIIGLFATEIELALVQGYAGVRVTGEETFSLRGWPGTDRFAEFEQKIDDVFRTSEVNAMAICQYDRRWFAAKPLEHLLGTHRGEVRIDDVYDDEVLRISPTFTPPGLALAGAVEESTFPALSDALHTLGRRTGHLCLDLSEVDYCDMGGLRTMLSARTSPDGYERMLLLRGVREPVAELLRVAGWSDLPGLVVEEA